MKRTPLPLLLIVALAACTSTSGPAPAGSVAAASAASVAPTASPSAPTPALAPSGSAPAPAPTFDRMAGIGAGPKDVTEVVPDVSIGPIKLGMTRAELKTLGFVGSPFPDEYSRDVIDVIPYHIALRDDRVDGIEANLTKMPKGLRIRGKVLSPRSTLEDLQTAFADCEPIRKRLGGSSYRCEGKRLLVKRGGGSRQIQVQILSEPDLDPHEEGFH